MAVTSFIVLLAMVLGCLVAGEDETTTVDPEAEFKYNVTEVKPEVMCKRVYGNRKMMATGVDDTNTCRAMCFFNGRSYQAYLPNGAKCTPTKDADESAQYACLSNSCEKLNGRGKKTCDTLAGNVDKTKGFEIKNYPCRVRCVPGDGSKMVDTDMPNKTPCAWYTYYPGECNGGNCVQSSVVMARPPPTATPK